MTDKHPVLRGFWMWLAWNTLFILTVWIILPKWNPVFLQVVLNNMGISYYNFFFFFWFVFLIGSFVIFIIAPSTKRGGLFG